MLFNKVINYLVSGRQQMLKFGQYFKIIKHTETTKKFILMFLKKLKSFKFHVPYSSSRSLLQSHNLCSPAHLEKFSGFKQYFKQRLKSLYSYNIIRNTHLKTKKRKKK